MPGQDHQHRYGTIAISLHWLIALFVLCTICLGLSVERLEMGDTKDAVTTLHKSIGITIFVLTIMRLGWRGTHPAPPQPQSFPKPQRIAAIAAHFILYGLTLVMPLSGYVSVAARARETTWFWLIDIPRWVPLDRALARSGEALHSNGQYVLYVLLAGHISAALYHRLVLKDQIFQRMWPSNQ